MKIETYSGKFDDEIITLILSIQNDEAKIGLSIQEQPDLLDIHQNYLCLIRILIGIAFFIYWSCKDDTNPKNWTSENRPQH